MEITKEAQLTGHSGAIYCLEYYKESLFFSAGFDNLVVVWNAASFEEGVVVAKLKSKAISLLYIKQLNWLVAGQSTGGVHIIDLDSKEEIKLFQGHVGMVYALHYNKNLNELYVGAEDGKLSSWDLTTLKSKSIINLFRGKIREIRQFEDLLYIGVGDGSIGVFTVDGLREIAFISEHMNGFSVNTIMRLGNYILSGSRDGHINVVNISSSKYVLKQRIPAHNYAIYKIVQSPNKKYYASASRDKSIKIWDLNHNFIAKIDSVSNGGHLASVNNLIWFDNYLISTGDDKTIIIWKIVD
ncbi:MAG: hypothetical protein AB8B74_05905 [Crocinitomicaceae bacterium]